MHLYLTLLLISIVGELSLPSCALHVTMIKTLHIGDGTSVNEGGKLVLACVTDCDVSGTVEWRHNRTAVNFTDTRYHAVVIGDGDKLRHTLTVSHARQEDAGLFECRIIFTDRITVDVIVMKALELMPSMSVTAGHNITLDCEGVISAVISWYHDGRRLTVGSAVAIDVKNDVDNNRQRSLLTRINVDENASGDYLCKDETARLDSSRTVKVIVHQKPQSTGSRTIKANLLLTIFSLLLFIIYTEPASCFGEMKE